MQGLRRAYTEFGAPVVPVSDEQLLMAITTGKQSALDAFYARHNRLLRTIISGTLPNHADAEEALQDVFAEVWRCAANYDVSRGKPLDWTICIARRRAIDRRRKAFRRVVVEEQFRQQDQESRGVLNESLMGKVDSSGGPAINDLRRFLGEIISSLPNEQAQVIRWSYFEQLSQRDISTRFGIPLGTVKTRLELALRKLSSRLAFEHGKF